MGRSRVMWTSQFKKRVLETYLRLYCVLGIIAYRVVEAILSGSLRHGVIIGEKVEKNSIPSTLKNISVVG